VRDRRPFLSLAVEYSLALPVGATLALLWANLFTDSYIRTSQTLAFPVNDIGMVFFFALAAKDVVDATAPGGALHTWRRAALPVIAAAGGMIVPALLYVFVAHGTGQSGLLRGWAIPSATDIAFSYLVAKLIFRRHAAVPFVLLLAIADDAFGLVILAAFYPTGDLHVLIAAVLMSAAVLTAYGLRRADVRSFWPYVLIAGSLSWSALRWGGLHPALALVPIVPFLPRRDTLHVFERWWKLPVQLVLFVFALANAGVPLIRYGPGTWAVAAGLIAGKPLGIGAATALAVAVGLRLPDHFGWRDVVVVGFASGIGFTVALFFAAASFPPGPLLDETKIGALASLASGAVAVVMAKVLRSGRFGEAVDTSGALSTAERP
jgi:NhaA family Na+:H+ antiporter